MTTIGPGASVELVGSGSFPKLSGLTGVAGSLRLSGGKDLTTTGSLLNIGTVAVGPQSRLSVTGTFTNTGSFVTGIAGAPATGQFGDVVATGSLVPRRHGVGRARSRPTARRRATCSRSCAAPDVTSQFATVDTPGFTPAYTSTSFVLNGTGSVPGGQRRP